MIRKFRRRIALVSIAAICAVTLQPKEARSQAQLLAPALCSTGVGCILVGVATVGGIAYWVWQSRDTGKQHYLKIEDPEEEAAAMGNNAQEGRTIIARNASHAHSRCSKWAAGRRVATPRNLGNGRWKCRYY